MEEKKKSYLYYNSPQGWRELSEKEMPLLDSPILFDVQKKRAICQNHCRWESAELLSDTKISLSCGREQEGLIVFCKKDKKESISPEENGVILKKWSYWSHKNLYSDDIDFLLLVENVESGFINLDDDTVLNEKEVLKRIFDEFFAIEVSYDTEKYCARVIYYMLDSEKAENLKEGSLQWVHIPVKTAVNYFNFQGKEFKNRSGFDKYTIGVHYSFIEHENLMLPDVISRKIEDIAEILLKNFAKREVRVTKNLFQGQNFLNALCHCPYEIALFKLYNNEYNIYNCSNYIEHDNFDCYNRFCQHLGFKSFPSLRKLFEIRPEILLRYAILHDIGFRDKNIMLAAIQDNSLMLWEIDGRFFEKEPFQFFFDVSKAFRGEKEILKAICRDKNNVFYERIDTARMFREYYPLLEVEERNKIVREGLTLRNHDLLVKFQDRIENENIVFNHSEMTKKVEMSVAGYDFCLMKDSDSLHRLGASMSNCVYSYRNLVLKKNCVIVCAMQEDLPMICIEARRKAGVVQALGRYNRRLNIEEECAVEEWWSKVEKFITQNPDLI